MRKNLSPQTKSFLVLFGLAVVGTYLVTMLQRDLSLDRKDYKETAYQPDIGAVASASDVFMPEFKPLDTADWKTYTDQKFHFSFKYDPAWKVLPGKPQDGFHVLEIDPGSKYYNMKVYISQNGFYGIDGLPSVETVINGLPAKNVSNLLYGIKAGPFYYTFDNGLSTSMLDNFNSWVRTVKFE